MTSLSMFEDRLAQNRPESMLPDHHPLYSAGDALAEANRCLYCHDAPCQAACPTHIDVAGFIQKISTGNVLGAAKTILAANVNALSCARVCPVEELCAGACVYTHQDGGQPAIHIGRLQQYAVEAAYTKGTVAALLGEKAPTTGKRVALVGAGPASLACAARLTLLGHRCVILEAKDLPGGLNTTGVAPYKMQASQALREVGMVISLGVELRTGVNVGKDILPAQLLEQYDAVFLGVGLGPDGALGCPGEELPGIHGAVALIERIKTHPGSVVEGVAHAMVVGGGNTAMDAARELKLLGVPEVTVVYRRGAPAMSAYEHEQAGVRGDGVRFLHWHQPARFGGEGRVRSVTLARTIEENGKLCLVSGSEQVIPVDLVALAVGQSSLAAWCAAFPQVEFAHGKVVVDAATGATGNPKVYAGGDVANGGQEVVNATQEGQRAAAGIHAWLRGGA